jgi:hypothetical protein
MKAAAKVSIGVPEDIAQFVEQYRGKPTRLAQPLSLPTTLPINSTPA